MKFTRNKSIPFHGTLHAYQSQYWWLKKPQWLYIYAYRGVLLSYGMLRSHLKDLVNTRALYRLCTRIIQTKYNCISRHLKECILNYSCIIYNMYSWYTGGVQHRTSYTNHPIKIPSEPFTENRMFEMSIQDTEVWIRATHLSKIWRILVVVRTYWFLLELLQRSSEFIIWQQIRDT